MRRESFGELRTTFPHIPRIQLVFIGDVHQLQRRMLLNIADCIVKERSAADSGGPHAGLGGLQAEVKHSFQMVTPHTARRHHEDVCGLHRSHEVPPEKSGRSPAGAIPPQSYTTPRVCQAPVAPPEADGTGVQILFWYLLIPFSARAMKGRCNQISKYGWSKIGFSIL